MENTGEIPSADIRVQLERILASKAFSEAEKLKKFLLFTIDETLQNRAEHLKEYLIGVEVYARDSGFDPRIDPIVRVQARKLRSRLDEFYSSEGQNDPIIIQYPKGHYRTCLPEARSAKSPSGAARSRRSVQKMESRSRWSFNIGTCPPWSSPKRWP